MKRRHITLIIIITVVVTLLIDILFGNYIGARLATLPIVKKFHFLQPNAPIVINNRETVRVSDANDAIETANSLKAKMSVLVYLDNGRLVHTGAAINWTTDGYFITSVKAFTTQNKTYAVVTSNGDIFPVKNIYPDPASSLVMIDTDAGNVPNMDTVENKDLRPGQKLLFVGNNIPGNKVTFLESYIHSLATDIANVQFNADQIVRGVNPQAVGPLLPGQPGVTLDGKMAGMWTGEKFLSSDAIRIFANNFFSDNKTVNRPAYGFLYRQISSVEAKAAQTVPGALVINVTAGSAAAVGGLQAGDIITSVNGKDIGDDVLVEEQLEPIKPGQRVTVLISRKGASQTLVITPTLLK